VSTKGGSVYFTAKIQNHTVNSQIIQIHSILMLLVAEGLKQYGYYTSLKMAAHSERPLQDLGKDVPMHGVCLGVE
jgi:hypothetical protein